MAVLRDRCRESIAAEKKKILVCAGTGCISSGSLEIYDRLAQIMNERGIPCSVELQEEPHDGTVGMKKSGCHGFCEMGPLIRIEPQGYLYTRVQMSDCEEIIESTLIGDEHIERLAYKKDGTVYKLQEEILFYKKQSRLVLEHCGHIDATSIKEYLGVGGYAAFEKTLFDMSADDIINEISESNLRGRGGGGFPAGRKWSQVKRQKPGQKYIVCNGDEGDPGAFMDRSIMEGDPHSVLEGLIIGAYAIGASKGFLYIRDEYGLALSYVQAAMEEAKRSGYLGENILNSGFHFDCEIVRGGGAFVCGESSALMNSIEGKVGEPRAKYIRSVEKGLFGKPTVLNNVETLANIPYILLHGGKEYSKLGTATSKGTKVFSLVGKVKRTGLVEVPMGITLRDLVFRIGGGIPKGRKFKAVQTGGPSGGCIPESLMDLNIDFDSLKANGSMMGSGGIIVMDDTTCMVELARYYVKFLSEESCGKCTPCREGLRCMLEILTRICEGNGAISDLNLLEELCDTASKASLCELGKTAANPVLSTLNYFREEYIEHIVNKRCPAGVCPQLTTFRISADLCKGCGLCAKGCPVNAIKGEMKKPFLIHQEACIKCGSCREKCPFGAIAADGGSASATEKEGSSC